MQMKTYVTLSGFDASQIVSLIVKFGIESGDRIIIIRPLEEKDSRGEATIQAIKDLSRQIDSSIYVDIYRVNHRNFEEMVVSLIDLIKRSEGEIVANLSGGPREIFLAFTLACLAQPSKIYKTTSYSDIDRSMNEIVLPNIRHVLDEKSKRILGDVMENQPTTIKDVAARSNISESTASRQITELVDIKALNSISRGKTKQVFITLTGRMLL
jgi:CRISPR-associated protein Csa3